MFHIEAASAASPFTPEPFAPAVACKSDAYADIVDMGLLVGVFIAGWTLTSVMKVPLYRHGIKSVAQKSLSCHADFDYKDRCPSQIQCSPSCDSDFEDDANCACFSTSVKSSPSTRAPDSPYPCEADFDPLADMIDEMMGVTTSNSIPDLPSFRGAPESVATELASNGDFAAFWRWWEIQPKSFSLDEDICNSLSDALISATSPLRCDVDNAVKVAVESNHAGLADSVLRVAECVYSAFEVKQLMTKILEAGMPCQPERVKALARQFGREGHPDLEAEMWFELYEQRVADSGGHLSSNDCDKQFYSEIVEVCARTGNFAFAAKVADAAAWRSPHTQDGQAAFLVLARNLARSHGVNHGRRCLISVVRAGGQADMATVQALVEASVLGGDMDRAENIFQEMFEWGLSPNSAVLSLLVRGQCVNGGIEKAVKHFRSMRRIGLIPHVKLFDALLVSCTKRNLWTVAEQVLAEMLSLGVQPTSTTVASVVRLHGIRGSPTDAFRAFEDLTRRHDVELESRCVHAIVMVCLEAGVIDLALQALKLATSHRVSLLDQTYQALISALVRHDRLYDAADFVRRAYCIPQGIPSGVTTGSLRPRVVTQGLTSSVEEVLRLAGRRRESLRVGLPLLAALCEVGGEVDEKIATDLRIQAAQDEGQLLNASEECRRSVTWRRWSDDFGILASLD